MGKAPVSPFGKIFELSADELDTIINRALDEDSGRGDITSEALIPRDLTGKAIFLIKEKGVLAGIDVAMRVCKRVDAALNTEIFIKDSTPVEPQDIVGAVSGSVISILKAERIALNFLQRMSGIASLTAQYVEKVRGTGTRILDTRKTTPGLRRLEKYSVRAGGGMNHRFGLGEAVLIKDNHIAVLRASGMTLPQIIAKAREHAPADMTLEVEVTNLSELQEALEAGADIIMLDNMSVPMMKKAVEITVGQAKLEASGNITLANVRKTAETGVDFISVGALTHSFKSLDISLELEEPYLKGMKLG
jgi:nicotinate-nucleotide pyrophosphorylase (carboxylating)